MPLMAEIDDAVESGPNEFADPVARADAASARTVPLLLSREAQRRIMLKSAFFPLFEKLINVVHEKDAPLPKHLRQHKPSGHGRSHAALDLSDSKTLRYPKPC
jgi:hypothetical protein